MLEHEATIGVGVDDGDSVAEFGQGDGETAGATARIEDVELFAAGCVDEVDEQRSNAAQDDSRPH